MSLETISYLVIYFCLFLIRETTSQGLSVEQLLPRPIFGDTNSIMSVCFLFLFELFSPVYAVVKQTTVLVFHATQRAC